jgi:hypothetical protein
VALLRGGPQKDLKTVRADGFKSLFSWAKTFFAFPGPHHYPPRSFGDISFSEDTTLSDSSSAAPATNGTATDKAQQPPLFYNRPLPLSPQYHATVKIRPEMDFSFARETNAIPLTLPEFVLAARNYPIIFIGDELVPSVAVGLRPGDNLFVDMKGAWEASYYIPAYVRRFPFILLTTGNVVGDQEQLTLGIDDDARSSKDGAQSLFANDKETEVVTQAMQLCEHFHGAFRYSIDFTVALKASGITEQRSLEVDLPDGEKLQVGSFVAVNEEKFKNLPDATIIDWHRKGWMHAVYFHLQSLNNWEALLARTTNRMAAAANVR